MSGSVKICLIFRLSAKKLSHLLPVSGPDHSHETAQAELLGALRIRGLEGHSDRQEIEIKRENNAEFGARRHGFPCWLCSSAAV